MFTSLLSLIYLIKVQPFESSKLLRFEVFNEAVLLFQTYVIMSFTLGDDFKKSFDFIFISQCGVYLVIHLGNLFITIGKDIKKSIKKLCKKCKKK